MDGNRFFTKGDKDFILKRVDQVHTITIYCPINEFDVQCLKNTFLLMLGEYRAEEDLWLNVPAVDALRCFLCTKELIMNGNYSNISLVAATLKVFLKLKYISFKFTDDPEIAKSYRDVLESNRGEIQNNIYKVDILEFNLSDMFSQEVIDHFNKILMINEIIPNSYMERVFRINFTYDEYISFMDMFLGNYGPALHQMDGNICDYFRSFPQLIDEQKPCIRVITNYGNL